MRGLTREKTYKPYYPNPDGEKVTGSGLIPEPDFGLVETGEGRTPRPEEATQNILQA